MNEPPQPHEVAREALRRLAQRRIAPTPENYRVLYHEIAGTHDAEPFPEKALRSVVSRLPRATPTQSRFIRQIETALAAQDWSAFATAINAALEAREPRPWNDLIRQLLAQIETRHAGLTAARKRESLDHVLTAGGSDPDQFFQRLQALLKSWSQTAQDTSSPLAEIVPPVDELAVEGTSPANLPASATVQPAGEQPVAADAALSRELGELVAGLLENSIAALLAETPELATEAMALAEGLRGGTAPASDLVSRLKAFAAQLQWVAEDQVQLRSALLHLLQLLLQNIDELVMDDQWLHGQIAMLSDLFAEPLDVRRIDDVERRLKEVIYQQSALKQNLNDAKDRLRAMLASFVDHLASMTESTGNYHEKIGNCATRISQAKDITELSDVIEEVMQETRSMQVSAARSRDDMRGMQVRVEDAEREITRLQGELAHTSEMVRHDQLTGALNRKGLDEALGREQARAGRRQQPLCIGLLDVDNFKALNDGLGHQAGDDALVHMAKVVRETLRPHDTLARYGGEEFVVLLPETRLEDAVNVLARLQRELTRRFFLHDNERVLITFSAGVTALDPQEPSTQAIARADAAMYEAKRSGKNRVVAA
ncbi:MAG: GGDEF domain-containing protein [Rhodocyclaceae bacterium]